MSQRITLIISAAITVFSLVVIGGVVARVATQRAAQADIATPTASPPAPTADPQAALAAQFAEREAAYQQRLAEANARIQQSNEQLSQAYQKLQQMAAELNQAYVQEQQLANRLAAAPAKAPAAAPQPTTPPAPQYALAAGQAADIALAAAPGGQLARAPELVDFEGTIAYEVVLDIGTIYVDANSGQVLYNGAAQIAAQPSGRGDHGGEGHDD
ncbi:peptidase [Kouleothrix sp.]|uniref:peptidase n=1 Tax=Kouleothrix sp. TaxID=2779161 RepID=UPI00391DD741